MMQKIYIVSIIANTAKLFMEMLNDGNSPLMMEIKRLKLKSTLLKPGGARTESEILDAIDVLKVGSR